MAEATIEDSRFQVVNVKYNGRIIVLDEVCSETRCCEILSLIETRFDFKLAMNSRLKNNNSGRFLSMHETIEEV